jgi:hypothetical protein
MRGCTVQGRDFPHPSKSVLGLPAVKWLGRFVDHPPQSSAEVKERVTLYILPPTRRPPSPVLGCLLCKERISEIASKCRYYSGLFVCLFVCFHGRPWQVTDVPQPSWLFVPPALDVPTLATRCLRAYRRVPRSSGGSWNLWAENEDRQFSLKCRHPRYILGIFYMPQICDMEPMALLPFRRKACWGFFRP